MSDSRKRMGFYARYCKRPLDFFFSILAIACLSWALVLIAVLVKIFIGSPVLFKQERLGKGGAIFKLYKFRTMRDALTSDGRPITDNERQEAILTGRVLDVTPDERRTTRLGRFLRATSLDELPELFNILGGSMSFVGPRPLMKIKAGYYTPDEERRHEVLPGLTGLAQIRGRASIPFETRFLYDAKYVDTVSFLNDLRIIFKTFGVVFSGKDSRGGGSKIEPFTVTRQRQLAEIAGVEPGDIVKLPESERKKLLLELQARQRSSRAANRSTNESRRDVF